MLLLWQMMSAMKTLINHVENYGSDAVINCIPDVKSKIFTQ